MAESRLGRRSDRPRSPGFATDLALLRLQGSLVEEHADHLVVRTPANPTYHWGNCLILDTAPDSGRIGDWVSVFAREFPNARHVAIGIDDPDARIEGSEAAAHGLSIEGDVVLMTARPAPVPEIEGIVFGTLDVGDDGAWAALVDLELADLGPDVDAATREDMRVFRSRRFAGHRALAAAGHGDWYAAFTGDGEPIATLGLFGLPDGRARYQDVLTHPAYRRRGIAAGLVAHAGHRQLARGSRSLLIVADPDGPAIGTYRRAGFADHVRQWALYRAS